MTLIFGTPITWELYLGGKVQKGTIPVLAKAAEETRRYRFIPRTLGLSGGMRWGADERTTRRWSELRVPIRGATSNLSEPFRPLNTTEARWGVKVQSGEWNELLEDGSEGV